MRFRKRVRSMIEIFRRQVDHLHADEGAHKDGVVTPQESDALLKQLNSIRSELQRIAPPSPLTLREWVVRGGVLFVVVLAAGTLAAWKFQLLPAAVETNVSGQEGGVVTSEYVPITATHVRDFPLVNQVGFDDPTLVRSFATLEGVIVGLVPNGEQLILFYTAVNDRGVRSLVRQHINADGDAVDSPISFESDVDVLDASVLQLDAGWLVAAALHTQNGDFVSLDAYTDTWEKAGEQVILRQMDLEQFDGLTLSKTAWDDRPYVLLTIADPGDAGAIIDTRKIILRTFSPSLQLQDEELLEQPNMNADAHASFLGKTSDVTLNGFTIITNGGDPFEFDRIEKGDELMALQFDADFAPIEFFQLTNNGRPHDFWPESLVSLEDGLVLFSYVKQMIAPGADTTGQYVFPQNTGNLFVGVFDPTSWETVGTILVTNYDPQPVQSDEAKVGGTRPHIAKIGKRLYVAFDEHTTDDPFADTPTRRIYVQWFDLNR